MKRQPLNILLGPARLAPRTIPPLIELVLLFQVPAFPCYFGIRRLRNGRAPGLNKRPMKLLNDFVDSFPFGQPGSFPGNGLDVALA